MSDAVVADSAIIRVNDLVKRFGSVEVLRGITFDVKKGETLCILGGSGGGKSTLLNCMIGVIDATEGSVVIDGDDIVGVSERELDVVRRKFGVMFQGGALLNSMTIAQNIALPIEHHTKLDADTIETMVKMKLHQVDLLHAADRRPSAISGGMQKRAAVARALALDPKILFYDEPSAGLDPIATTRIDHLINKLKTTMRMTNIVVTHVMESVQRIADRIIMLDRGKVILDGTLDDLMTSDDPRIKQFRTGDLKGPGGGATSTEDYHRDLLM
ncbi:MAG: ATP-binding cassette domain-containing protein [Planctomycetes bacterium]|nr:ATP-binding cassette domain-containing protein [Planctomycetota bacterium]